MKHEILESLLWDSLVVFGFFALCVALLLVGVGYTVEWLWKSLAALYIACRTRRPERHGGKKHIFISLRRIV
jgi:hypothetical protein